MPEHTLEERLKNLREGITATAEPPVPTETPTGPVAPEGTTLEERLDALRSEPTAAPVLTPQEQTPTPPPPDLGASSPDDGGGGALLSRIPVPDIRGVLKNALINNLIPGGVGDPRIIVEGLETLAKPFATFAREGIALERAAAEKLGVGGRVIDPLDVGDESTVLRALKGEVTGVRPFISETQSARERLNFGQNLALDIGADPLNLIPGVGFTRLAGPASRGIAREVARTAPDVAARRARIGPGPLEFPGGVRPPPEAPTPPRPTQAEEETRKGVAETFPNLSGLLKGLSPEVQATVARLTGLVDEARPLLRAAIRAGRIARSEELSARVGRTAEFERQLRSQGVSAQEANRRATSQLSGELPAPVFDPLQIEPNEIRPLFEHISDLDVRFFERTNARVALERVLAGELPSSSEMELLRQIFGRPLVEALRGKRSLGAKTGEVLLDIFNAPRQILTAYDVSAPLRQGVVLLPGHPGRWAASVVTMFKSLAKEGAAQADDAARRADPNWLRFTARNPEGSSKNLFIADLSRGARGITGQEEQFMSRLANLIPGIRQSQRAYVTFLNKLRYDVMTDIVAGWEKQGIKVTSEDLDQLALFLNRATGRGSIGRLNEFAPILNTAFFAPRLLASRVQLPFSVASSSPLVRKQAAKDLTLFLGTGMTVLSLAALAGADVELDPRSSDFGKIRMGNTSIEYWGGFQSLARYLAQFALGERKTVSGKNRGDIVSQPGIDTLVRFLRSKLSPTASFGADVALFQSKDFLGRPLLGDDETTLSDALEAQALNRLVPLFIQDLTEAFQDDGITGLFKASPAGLGASAVTFERESQESPTRRRLR